MKHLMFAVSALSLLAGAGVASAQPGHDHGPGPGFHGGGPSPQHNWRRGGRIEANDWRRGQVVDYRRNHLRRPPRGYQWRDVDGNYVLAGIAGGVIADLIAH